jgi:hypothetical protein
MMDTIHHPYYLTKIALSEKQRKVNNNNNKKENSRRKDYD